MRIHKKFTRFPMTGPASGGLTGPGWCGLFLAILTAGATTGRAQEGAAPEKMEEAIPKAYPVDRYVDVWKNSPFQREAVAAARPMQKNFARDYAVIGMFKNGDDTVVTLINKKTRQYLRVNRDEKDGFKVIDIEQGTGSRDLKVTVTKDGEPGVLTYDDSYLNTPAVLAAAAPGNPGANGRKLVSPQGRPLPGTQKGSIVRPGQVGSPASSNAPVPSKPLPPANSGGQTNTQTSAGAQTVNAAFDGEPTIASRRRVVLPTKSGSN